MKKLKKGFTLLEILLVIALLGLLLAIVLVALNPKARFASARNDIRQSDIKKLESALTQYRLQEGAYPAGLDGTLREICDPDIANPSTNCGTNINLSALVPTYIQSIPQDPNDKDSTGGNGYQVAVDVTRNIVAVKAIQAESSATISINDPLSAVLPSTAINTPLAASNPQLPLNWTASSDSSIANVSLLLHMENGYIDSSPNNISVTTGTAPVSSYYPFYKFGAGAAILNDATDGFSVTHPTAFAAAGNEDYTIEFWLRPSGFGSFQYLAYSYGSLVMIHNNQIRVEQNGGSIGLEGGSLVAGQWYHIAVTKASGTMKIFIDGTSVATITGNTTGSTQTVAGFNPGPFRVANGTLVDEIRYTKGVARYTSNFTSTTRQFPDSSSTSPPSPPTGVVVNSVDNQQVTLSWNPSSSEITNYLVQYSSNNGSTWSTVTNPVLPIPKKTISGLVNGTSYIFRVAGVNPDGSGIYSTPTSSYTLPGSDTYYANTPTLLHFDGVDGSSTFTNSGNTSMTFGAAVGSVISTAQSKFGGASGLFNGLSYGVQTPYSSTLDFNGAFTFEGYFRLSSLPGSMILYSRAQSAVGIPLESAFYLTSPTNVNLYYGTRGISMQLRSFTLPQTLVTNQWYHIAITRDTTNLLRVFLDGVMSADMYTDNTNLSGGHPLTIGAFFDGSSLFNGNLEEFRFTKGVARYTAPFVPPINPFANN